MNTKVAIITGGAGGIGSATGREMARDGYRVLVVDREGAAAEQAADRLAAETGEAHGWVAADLTDARSCQSVVTTAQELGTVTTLVNAAGISPKTGGRQSRLDDIDVDTWDEVLAVNLRAPFMVSRAVAPVMPEDGTASIVNIHSVGGVLGASGGPGASYGPFYAIGSHYAASKAALQNLTMSLARELAPRRIRVNGVAPGLVATEMTAVMPDEDKERAVRQVPLGRFAEPEEIAYAVAFLAGEKASYMTGTSLNLSGGWHMP